jgi:glycerol-3-phosphate dehydrogenase
VEFSFKTRPQIINRLRSETFDLLIIGGGITGAGIALDAAARGLKTALVEKSDFASGTSSRSTKLIHGGLRYLKQLEFGLVKEVGSERAVVHRLAPHLTIPEKMLLPLYEKRGFGSTLTSVGLKLYDWLAGVKLEDQRKMLTRSQTLKAEPILNPEDVKGGALYAEYRTDDARLTIEIVKTAFRKGALLINYCKAIDINYEDEKVSGLKVRDEFGGETFSIKAKVIVNAAGPWVDEIRELNRSKEGKSLHLTKGVHIVVPRERLPIKQSIYFDVEDGRMIFAIPRGRTTYIGTTDTNYVGEKEDVHASNEDVDYLVKAVNRTFVSVDLKSSDVESSWAGLRPLIHEDGKSASELSRKDEIFESKTGLISIAGGKLTGYRKMAERVVDLVIDRAFEDRNLATCKTRNISLTERSFSSNEEVRQHIALTAFDLRQHGIDEQLATYLVHNYGKQIKEVVEFMNENSLGFEAGLIKAEIDFVVKHEMTLSPEDFFFRRTGMALFNIHRAHKHLDLIISEFQNHLGWDEKKTREEHKKIVDSLQSTTHFH